METFERRYDIDWVRVIAIGLLLIYHAAIGFQSWGGLTGFIVNSTAWEALWVPMAMLNIWRIPLLFFVSGMGVYFALQNRNWKQLLTERTGRILIPFAFGIFTIVPLHLYLLQYYYAWPLSYSPNPAHLWFLGNLFACVVFLLPVFYFLKKHERNRVVVKVKKQFATLSGILIVLLSFVAEVLLVSPIRFEMYAMTWHGFYLGLLAFFFGFCFMFSGFDFWIMLQRYRWGFLAGSLLLFLFRFTRLDLHAPMYYLAVESNLWIFSVFAFSFRHLNRPGKILQYLSQAAFPVYILHMLFLSIGSLLIFPLQLNVYLKFALLLLFTVTSCFLVYEYLIRRKKLLSPLFGLRKK